MTTQLQGFARPSSSTSLVDDLLEMVLALRSVDMQRLANFVRLPANEVGASPFGLRAVAMGAAVGAFHVHRELTHVPEFGDDPRVIDERHDQWRGGVLQTGKYQAFMQDASLSLFDPSHVAKWGPHELMHRACAYFWREDASDFEFYLAARLGEALPVSLWYEADQILRDEPVALTRDLLPDSFVRESSGRALEEPRWWRSSRDELRACLEHSASRLQAMVDAVHVHLDAVRKATKTGRMESARLFQGTSVLDAESDALAYCIGHRSRLRDSAMAEVLGDGFHFETIDAYADHIEANLERLVYASFDWSAGNERDARVSRHRAFQRALGGEDAELADGVQGIDLAQLAEGLEQSLPHTFGWLEAHGGDWLEDFANSKALWQRASLAQRLASFLEKEGAISNPSAALDLTRLESIFLSRRADTRCEELGEDEGTFLLPSAAFSLENFTHDPHAWMDEEALGAPVTLLAGVAFGRAVSFPAEGALVELWQRLQSAPLSREAAIELVGNEMLTTLLETGVVSAFTPPQG